MIKREAAAVVAALLLVAGGGCAPSGQQPGASAASQITVPPIRGRADYSAPRATQAVNSDVNSNAAVSLIDSASGNTVATTLTDAGGGFVLTFSGLTPASGAVFVLEIAKGLAMGGLQNRAGSPAVRLRTLLIWNGGWQSLTNTTVNTGIVVSQATTAVAIAASLAQQAGIGVSMTSLAGTVTGSTFAGGGGLTAAADFTPLLPLVSNAISLDQDPVAAIARGPDGEYQLGTGVPRISSFSPAVPTPGGTVVVRGAYLDRLPGRNAFWFGSVAATSWTVSADRTTATVSVPASAFSAPFTLWQPGGVRQTISPFLFLHGTVGTFVGGASAGFADGPATSARFSWPYNPVFDAAGNMWVGDASNARIRRISPAGVVTTFAGGAPGFADGSGLEAQFQTPRGLTFDPAGNLYVADDGPAANNAGTIRKITPAGVVTTFAGNWTIGYTNAVGKSAQFNDVLGIAADSFGNLYVGDFNNNVVRKVAPSGAVTTFAGSTAGLADGCGGAAKFTGPSGMAVDASDNVYVYDTGNYAIRKITPAGCVTTLAGNGTAGFADGTGAAARFAWGHGIGVDSGGNVYVADGSNYRIRKVTQTGVVTTVAGTGISGFLDGAAPAAQFAWMFGLGVDPAGRIFVTNGSDSRIRVYTP